MDAASSPCGLTYDDASGLVSRMTVLDWLLDSDPAIRWQVLSDLVHAPAQVVAAERERVATEGWGARLLALQGEDGQWAGGACFPARSFNQSDENQGQPWTATLPTLQLLRDFGVDPCSDRARRAVALVRDHCRWEHAGQPFFSGEVEPCINGRTVTLGTYFDQDVDGVVARCWRTRIRARSTLRSRTATVGPAGGTRCGRCVSSAGTSSRLPEPRSLLAS